MPVGLILLVCCFLIAGFLSEQQKYPDFPEGAFRLHCTSLLFFPERRGSTGLHLQDHAYFMTYTQSMYEEFSPAAILIDWFGFRNASLFETTLKHAVNNMHKVILKAGHALKCGHDEGWTWACAKVISWLVASVTATQTDACGAPAAHCNYESLTSCPQPCFNI